MKKNGTHLWLWVLYCLASVNHQASATTQISFCYEEQQLPPWFMGESAEIPATAPGIFIDMLYLLDKRIPEINISLHRVPWKRCLNELKTAESDMVVASYQKERESFAAYPMVQNQPNPNMAISRAESCLFTSKNSELNWNGEQFTNVNEHPIAVPQGYSAVALLKEFDLPLVFTNSSFAAMELLRKNRVEGTVTFCAVGKNYINSQPSELDIVARHPSLRQRHGYLVFSKIFRAKHPELSQQIWRTAAAIRDSEFPRLLAKYEALQVPDTFNGHGNN